MSYGQQGKNRRARRLQIGIIATTLVIVGAILFASIGTRHGGPVGEWQEVTSSSDSMTPWVFSDLTYPDRFGSIEGDEHPGWAALNEAMQNHDREAFLSFGAGEAKEQMARWWDNTTKIGWDTAYMLPHVDLSSDPVEYVFLGANLAFSATPPRGAGSEDGGLLLTQGFPYRVTFEEEGADLTITSLEPTHYMPWDEGEIHVAERDHVVLYGMADEAALVDANADLAEEMAVRALEAIGTLAGDLHVEGFVSSITDEQQRFGEWQWEPNDDVAGFARPTSRPNPSPYLPENVATGDRTSGGLVSMGPRSADQRADTFVHEFAHILHYVGRPTGSRGDSRGYEGFARFFEEYAGIKDIRTDDAVKRAVAEEGFGAFDVEALRDRDDLTRVNVAYAAAGLYFKFVHERGEDVWDFALETIRPYYDFEGASFALGPDFSEPEWQAWVAGL